jgi:hypothetical protein
MYSQFMGRDPRIDKLSDEFGQYLILLKCECGHERRCNPNTLAAFAGWDTRLKDVVRRMSVRSAVRESAPLAQCASRSRAGYATLDDLKL